MGRKRSTRPKTWRSYAGKALSLATTAGIKALKKKLGLNTENKNWDVTVTQTTTAGLLQLLTPFAGIVQGNTNNARSGNGMRVTHLNIKGCVQGLATNANNQLVRLIVTHQKDDVDAGNFVTPAQLLQDSVNIYSPYNTDLQGVKVLYDETIRIAPTITSVITTIPISIKWDPSYDDGQVAWTDADTTGVAGNMTKGLVRLYVMADGLANFPTITLYSRTYFVDN